MGTNIHRFRRKWEGAKKHANYLNRGKIQAIVTNGVWFSFWT